ncbi:hypothetical protein BurMR1_1823 [Burkholderia sp. MR1]|nr:hypothetical protein BurMR1_1823 [Burkholderia sp. MR1]
MHLSVVAAPAPHAHTLRAMGPPGLSATPSENMMRGSYQCPPQLWSRLFRWHFTKPSRWPGIGTMSARTATATRNFASVMSHTNIKMAPNASRRRSLEQNTLDAAVVRNVTGSIGWSSPGRSAVAYLFYCSAYDNFDTGDGSERPHRFARFLPRAMRAHFFDQVRKASKPTVHGTFFICVHQTSLSMRIVHYAPPVRGARDYCCNVRDGACHGGSEGATRIVALTSCRSRHE